jgi:hypothetical protein
VCLDAITALRPDQKVSVHINQERCTPRVYFAIVIGKKNAHAILHSSKARSGSRKKVLEVLHHDLVKKQEAKIAAASKAAEKGEAATSTTKHRKGAWVTPKKSAWRRFIH